MKSTTRFTAEEARIRVAAVVEEKKQEADRKAETEVDALFVKILQAVEAGSTSVELDMGAPSPLATAKLVELGYKLENNGGYHYITFHP